MKFATLILIIFFPLLAFACFQENDLSALERNLASDAIIEGTVINQHSVWLANDNRIITIHTVEIEKNFTANKGGLISIITNGGIVNDEWHVSTAEMEINLGDKGVFFLAEKQNYKINNGTNITANYAHLGKHSFLNLKSKNDKLNEAKAINNIYSELPIVQFSKTSNNETSRNNKQQATTTNNIIINCVYPNISTAGNNDTMVIQGNGFGSYALGSSVVLFKNPDNGGYDFTPSPEESIIKWTDNEIILTVPQNAGSGNIQVYNELGYNSISDFEITIMYSIKCANKDQKPTHLINKNGFGGYTFSLGNSLKNSAAKEALLRAMKTLQKEVGFNIQISNETTEIEIPKNDGVDVIAFSETALPGSALAVAYNQFRRCGNGWEAAGMDIFFRTPSDNYKWYFNEEAPSAGQLDFESVALNELLHAFQVNHNNQTESVMYCAYVRGTNKRNLTKYELTAASSVNKRTLGYKPTCTGHNSYILYTGFETVDLSEVVLPAPTNTCIKAVLNAKVFLEGFYKADKRMNTCFAANGLLPIEQPFKSAPCFYNGNETFDTTKFNLNEVVDWIIISFYEENKPDSIALKMAGVLLNNGSVAKPNGDSEFVVEGLNISSDYFISIKHANHLEIKSTNAINLVVAEFYDFTTDKTKTVNQVIATTTDGTYAMYSGDFDGNGLINNIDYNAWANNSAGLGAYSPTDADGNSIINNIDYNIWANNRSKISPAVLGN